MENRKPLVNTIRVEVRPVTPNYGLAVEELRREYAKIAGIYEAAIREINARLQTLDSEFHRQIYAYCQSKVLYTLLSDLHRKVQRFRRASVADPARARAAVAEHRRILDALSAHDRELANRLAVEHIQNAHASIRRSHPDAEH